MGRDDLVASAAYQPEPMAAAAARRFVRDTLQEWMVTGPPADGHGLIDDAVLLTSELVTNAVVHAGTPVQVLCRLAGGAVEVVVSDGHPARWVPEPAENDISPAERTSGRGLLLPSALASAWGVTYGQASKAVWFRLGLTGPEAGAGGAAGGSPGSVLADPAGGAEEDRAVLAAAVRSANREEAAAPAGYRKTLTDTVETARSAVGADATVLLMADEDGDLRLQAAAGTMPQGAGGLSAMTTARRAGWPVASMQAPAQPAPAVLTVPFLADGRVSGLLAAVSAPPRTFGDAESARLQRLADACGPSLQRAWLGELERLRRGRAGAFGEMRGLLAGSLERGEIMAIVGRATVPRLAPWCAVLLRDGDAGPRAAYVRHADAARQSGLAWLLERCCAAGGPVASSWPRPGRALGLRWPLALPAPHGAPPGTDELTAGAAWCFPFGSSGDDRGVLVIGTGPEHRLPREVVALAADLACRIGVALAGARLVSPGASG